MNVLSTELTALSAKPQAADLARKVSELGVDLLTVHPVGGRSMLESAAADAGRPVRWIEWRGQAPDHPEIVQIPESSYLKGAILQVV